MIYYKHFIGDYQRKTNRLSILEDGVYRRLLDEYYANESPLPLENDENFRLVRAIKPVEKKAVLKILSTYFTKTQDGYIQERADEQITEYKGKSEQASRSARARWDAKPMQTDMRTHEQTHMPIKSCDRNAIPETRNQIPQASNHKPQSKDTPQPPSRGDRLFESFWIHYPKKVGKGAALRAWKKHRPGPQLAETMTAAIQRQVEGQHFNGQNGGTFIPNPSTWINQERWKDEIQSGGGEKIGPDDPRYRGAFSDANEPEVEQPNLTYEERLKQSGYEMEAK